MKQKIRRKRIRVRRKKKSSHILIADLESIISKRELLAGRVMRRVGLN